MNILFDFLLHDVMHNGGAGRFQSFHRQQKCFAAEVKSIQLAAQTAKMLTADRNNDNFVAQNICQLVMKFHIVGKGQIRIFAGVAQFDKIRRCRNVIHVNLFKTAVVSGIPA